MKSLYENEMKLEFLSKSSNEAFARISVAAFASQLDPTIEEMADIKTAVSEAVTNCIVHGYENTCGIVKVVCKIFANSIEIEISDTGKGIENVELATQLCKNSLNPDDILDKVGLSNRKNNFPAQLSGGEQQRVAIARAICKNPKLLLCDEPTGALDYITGKQILKLLQDTCRLEHMTVIIITHNSAICPMADKVIKFKNGAVSDVIINDKPMDIKDIEW